MKGKRAIRVGMVGGGAIARAHVVGYRSSPMLHELHSMKPVLAVVADATEELAAQAASKFEFESHTGDWKNMVSSDEVDLVDIVAPTFLHAEVAVEAAEHGKSILCEKPMAASSEEAKQMYDAATKAGVVNAMGFNYRRLPAVLQAKKLILEGAIGRVLQFRASFMEDWGMNPQMPFTWRYQMKRAGGGAISDLGSHIIDIARFLLGELRSVCAVQDTFIKERTLINDSSKSATVDVDDYTSALVWFESGVPGRIETSWSSLGRKVFLDFEVNGSEGSLYYNFERPNELNYYSAKDPGDRQGYRTIMMGPAHPYGQSFTFPATGSGAGFQDSLNNEIFEVLNAVANSSSVKPDFYDGWKVTQVIEAIQESSKTRKWVDLK
jgi:predicted dehydrogenase